MNLAKPAAAAAASVPVSDWPMGSNITDFRPSATSISVTTPYSCTEAPAPFSLSTATIK